MAADSTFGAGRLFDAAVVCALPADALLSDTREGDFFAAGRAFVRGAATVFRGAAASFKGFRERAFVFFVADGLRERFFVGFVRARGTVSSLGSTHAFCGSGELDASGTQWVHRPPRQWESGRSASESRASSATKRP